jgi:hypothetical protein
MVWRPADFSIMAIFYELFLPRPPLTITKGRSSGDTNGRHKRRKKMKSWMLMIAGCCASVGAFAQSANLKVVEMNGHLSPVAIRINYPNGASREAMLVGIGSPIRDVYLTHHFVARADGGATERSFWFDAIASIRGTNSLRTLNDEFLITLKNGTQTRVMFAAFHDTAGGACTGEPTEDRFTCEVLWVRNQDDSLEKVDLRKVQSVDFLGAARKDRANNAMFDPWRYSPFTGEKLN